MHRRAISLSTGAVLVLTTAVGAAAQGAPKEVTPHVSTGQEALSAATIGVNVFGPGNKPLTQQAYVTLYKMGANAPLSTLLTDRSSQAVFSNLPGFGWYTVTASSAGYETGHKDVHYDRTSARVQVDIALHPLSSADVTSNAAPGLAPRVEKHMQKGLEAMRAGGLHKAQKEFSAAYAKASQDADVCFLLGITYLREKDIRRAQALLEKATSIDPQHVLALVALGQLHYQQKNFETAIPPLEKAASLDSKQWLPRWILADIYLRAGKYEVARKDAEEAFELGKGAANKAEWIEGQALVQLGRREDAIKMLEAFLHDVPGDPTAPDVQALITKLKNGRSEVPSNKAVSERLEFSGPVPIPDVDVSSFLVPDWEPPSVDTEKPAIAEGLACPADHVIDEAGRRVTELVYNFNRIAATEEILYEDLNSMGRPFSSYKRTFDYVISISETSPGMLDIDENRGGPWALQKFPQHMTPFSLAGLAVIFHPEYRSDFQMECEGLGKWRDQATWLVYFRQRADRPQRIRIYADENGSYSSGLKGRAWISAETFQIVRLEAELMAPIPQIGLGSERDAIEYGPVPFPKYKTELWLPMTAEIYFYYQHHPYHRRHTFSHYMLFSVSANQKIGQPKEATEEK
jgi:tetratricopeptide (TPR) repeat protein